MILARDAVDDASWWHGWNNCVDLPEEWAEEAGFDRLDEPES